MSSRGIVAISDRLLATDITAQRLSLIGSPKESVCIPSTHPLHNAAPRNGQLSQRTSLT